MLKDDEPIQVVPYDPTWHELGRQLVQQVADQLSDVPLDIAVVELHGRLWADNIIFRDYLRTHPAARTQCARSKLSVANEAGALREYSALKSDTVSQILSQARAALDIPQPAGTAGDRL